MSDSNGKQATESSTAPSAPDTNGKQEKSMDAAEKVSKS